MRVTATWMLMNEKKYNPATECSDEAVRTWILNDGGMGTWRFFSYYDALNHIIDSLGFLEEVLLVDIRGVPEISWSQLFHTHGIEDTMKGLADGTLKLPGVRTVPVIRTSLGDLSRTILSKNSVGGGVGESSLLSFLQLELKQVQQAAEAHSDALIYGSCARGRGEDGSQLVGYIAYIARDLAGNITRADISVRTPLDGTDTYVNYPAVPDSLCWLPDFSIFPEGRS